MSCNFCWKMTDPGIFLLDDILESDSTEQPLVRRYSQLANAFFELKGRWARPILGTAGRVHPTAIKAKSINSSTQMSVTRSF
jgi:hypothetical protein